MKLGDPEYNIFKLGALLINSGSKLSANFVIKTAKVAFMVNENGSQWCTGLQQKILCFLNRSYNVIQTIKNCQKNIFESESQFEDRDSRKHKTRATIAAAKIKVFDEASQENRFCDAKISFRRLDLLGHGVFGVVYSAKVQRLSSSPSQPEGPKVFWNNKRPWSYFAKFLTSYSERQSLLLAC